MMDIMALISENKELASMNNEQLGIIFRGIMVYEQTGTIINVPDILHFTFARIIEQLEAANQKKKEKSEKARKSVEARWNKVKNATPAETEDTNHTNVYERIKNDTNVSKSTQKVPVSVTKTSKMPIVNNTESINNKINNNNNKNKQTQSNNHTQEKNRGLGEGKTEGVCVTECVFVEPNSNFGFEVDPADIETLQRGTRLLVRYGIKDNDANLDTLRGLVAIHGWDYVESAFAKANRYNDNPHGLTMNYAQWHIDHPEFAEKKKDRKGVKKDYGAQGDGWNFSDAELSRSG